jgi:glycosyltransferase involved in cell wall biosynthesis
VVENGPVKFANLLLEINRLYPQHELHILTEDTAGTLPYVHKAHMKKGWQKSPFSQFIRMVVYHRHAMRLRREYPFDVLVYNNALVGLLSAFFFKKTVGMINDYNNCSVRLTSFQLSQGWIKRWVFKKAEHLTALFSDKIIVNSTYLRELVCKVYSIPNTKVHRLYKGVDVRTEKRTSTRIDSTQPINILFVKTDYQLGGLPILAQAVKPLPFHFVVTVIGPTDSAQATIKAMFNEKPDTKVRVLGKRTQEEVFQQMLAADIFCVPSYREALGVANLEAMACGLPVVTTQVGGIPEVLDEGRCGWMVPPGDAVALTAALQQCITNPELRREKVEAAEQRVRFFSKEAMFHTFLTILTQ